MGQAKQQTRSNLQNDHRGKELRQILQNSTQIARMVGSTFTVHRSHRKVHHVHHTSLVFSFLSRY